MPKKQQLNYTKKMENLKIRCSSLGKIMGDGKKEELTQTAKSYVESLVKEFVFNYKTEIYSKYLDKGIIAEDDSIELYNDVFFTNYEKNTERLSNDFIEGECDIITNDKVIDIKSSWSKETFIATPEEIKNKDYEWQLRGYMWLYGVENAELAYCLVDTPDTLLEYEKNLSIHHCSDIDKELRVTVKQFKRDRSLEEKIKVKVNACRDYAQKYLLKIENKNK